MLQRVERIAALLEHGPCPYQGSRGALWSQLYKGFRLIPSRFFGPRGRPLRGAGLLASALGCDERGIELVEFVGFVPIVLLAVAIGWQFFLVGYTGVVASSAAREGARAAATRED